MLKNRNEIENYDLKSKVLKENGYETWYHDDNWIKTEWVNNGIKIDYAGIPTDVAYNEISDESLSKEKEDFDIISKRYNDLKYKKI